MLEMRIGVRSRHAEAAGHRERGVGGKLQMLLIIMAGLTDHDRSFVSEARASRLGATIGIQRIQSGGTNGPRQVVLFMKGNPDMPQCGFSRAVAQAPCQMFQGWNHVLCIMEVMY